MSRVPSNLTVGNAASNPRRIWGLTVHTPGGSVSYRYTTLCAARQSADFFRGLGYAVEADYLPPETDLDRALRVHPARELFA